MMRPRWRGQAGPWASEPRVLVLASGKQQRWRGHGNKHLAPIHGEPLLLRTLRQVRRHCDTRPVVVSHDQSTIEAVRHEADVLALPPERRRWATETALHSCARWGDPTWLLLGDVYWSDAAMSRIFGLPADLPPQYFTSSTDKCWDEILGIWFRSRQRKLMADAFFHAVLDAERGGRGKFWESYRSLCGFRMPKHRLEREHRTSIEDESTDFDTWEEYQVFTGRLWARAA